jgi:hypothetical protein
MIPARSRSLKSESSQNNLISLCLLLVMSISIAGCSVFGASYEIDAETENAGWVKSILEKAKFSNRGRKIYRFSSDKVSFVICGYSNVGKTFSIGPPLVPFIPYVKESSGNNLVVRLVVKNPGVELKVNFQEIHVELPGGRSQQYGHADYCITTTDNDEDFCHCFTPKEIYRRPDGSARDWSERFDLQKALRKPVGIGLVTVPSGNFLYTLIFHGLGIPQEFTIVFGDISVAGKSLKLRPLKFTKKFKKYYYTPISRAG